MRLLTSLEGMIAVSIRLTSSAANRKFSAVSSMSGIASAVKGFPCSSESSRANSSRRSSIRSAILWQTSPRSQADSAAHFGWASRAARAARAMSSSLALGASASFSPVAGETISRASSPVDSTQSPPMKFCSVLTVTAIAPSSCHDVDALPGFVENLAQGAHHLVELVGASDERRGELRARLRAVVEARVDAELAHPRRQERLDERVALRRRERFLRLLVLHELERVEVAVAAHVAHHRVISHELLATRAELGAELLYPRDQALALVDLDVGERDRTRERMPAERDPVREDALGLREEGLDRPRRCDDRPQWCVRGCDPLGERHQVGLDSVARTAEPVAGAPEPADDLVGDEQQPVLVADLADAVEISLRRDDRAARVLHRLENHGGNRLGALGLDDAVDLVGALQRAPRLLGAIRAAVAVRHRGVEAARQQRLELRAQHRAPVDGKRAERRPVVGAPARDEFRPARIASQAVVLAGDLHHGLVRLRPAADEEDATDVDREQLAELVGERERRLVREAHPVREEGQLLELSLRRLGDLRPGPVADVDAVERGEGVQIPLPLRV